MKLVTFGCSWTNGVGIHYREGMTLEEYQKERKLSDNKELRDKLTFRAHLSERLGYTNVNHACGGSSNQLQERLATEYFNNNSLEDTVVLWGITSITRNELTINGERKNFHYGNTVDEYMQYYIDHFYDEKTELERLGNMMVHWNKFFEGHKIPNLWFQTFNTYRFPQKIDRLLPRDLLTHLTRPVLRDVHRSAWNIDSKRIREAKDKGLVNPYSLHPTKETHILIADMLEKPLREIL
jgi:hypothetical protein